MPKPRKETAADIILSVKKTQSCWSGRFHEIRKSVQDQTIKSLHYKRRHPYTWIHDCRTLYSRTDLHHTRFSISGLYRGTETVGQRTPALGNSFHNQEGHTIRLFEGSPKFGKDRCACSLYLKWTTWLWLIVQWDVGFLGVLSPRLRSFECICF